MKTHQAELVLDTKSTLGEGPIWDAENKVLWWINVKEQKVHCYDPSTGSNATFEIGQQVGTVVPRKRGGLMLAIQNGFASFDPESGTLEIVNNPEADLPVNRFNDGKCDPAGRFWAGTMSDIEDGRVTGSLYCLHPNGSVEKRLSDVGCSNGIVWTSDAATMYYIDSPTRRVDAFDFDNTTGHISNRRTAVEIPDGMGFPDGMTIDVEDNIWVALWSSWSVACFDPRTGEMLEKVDVPVAQVTACAFAGPEMKDLYITTARIGIDDEALAEQPHAGGLFHAAVEIRGAVCPAFLD